MSKTNHELHVALWLWCAETGKHKDCWPHWKKNGGDVEMASHACFACNENFKQGSYSCINCPIKWSIKEEFMFCCNPESFYGKYMHRIQNIKKNRVLALTIAHLPWRNRGWFRD